ncbi:MAG: DUF2804 domain-containing protein [Clostridiales bacterium]|nr:DUF2804 domain-containing protein [Clostridiales bacterium]
MQNKLKKGPLLDNKGHLCEAGYSTTLIKEYDRSAIKANKLRIKEWDYYLIYNKDYAIALTIDDNSYMGLNSISLIDFNKPEETTKSYMSFMTKGKVGLPPTSKIGDVKVTKKNHNLQFINNGKTRQLKVWVKNFKDNYDLNIDITLDNEPKDSMVIATPFNKKTAFYYNQKIVGFSATGKVELGDTYIEFGDDTRAILDWGRAVWTYKNTWYWGAGCGVIDGHEVGFNIGYGFGDTTSASENMVFYDGIAHKLDQVTFNIPKDKKGKDDYMSDWTFTSNDKRFEMTFHPIINRHSDANVLVIRSNQNQVFGEFTGNIILDDGKEIKLNKFLGFAEKVQNKW